MSLGGPQRLIVTGGAGFIGSAVIRLLIAETDWQVVNLDKLTYAANLDTLAEVAGSPRYRLVRADIGDRVAVDALFDAFRPTAVLHLAAETHVDRSIDGPGDFIQTNVVGTYTLLEAARRYWTSLPSEEARAFRFQQVSTDEVFGSLGKGGAFTERTPYAPRSPYSASKAAADHLALAWHHTYGLPVLLTNCSNNYGLYQFPEKLIPLMILNAARAHPLPVYGAGANVRDWLYVEDHARALRAVLTHGRVGERYAIGGRAERRNIDVVTTIADLVDEFLGRPDGTARALITPVADRPGHDLRYAIDCAKMESELGWRPTVDFAEGLRRTVRWYLDHEAWWRPLVKDRQADRRRGLGDIAPAGGTR